MKPVGRKKKNLNLLLLNSWWLFGTVPAYAVAQNRENFLSHGPGTAAGALGEAFTAVADDATAIYYNPAGLAWQRGSIYAEHTPVLGGGRYNFIGLNYPSHWGAAGFGVIQYATDGIQTRRNIGDNPVETNASQTAWFIPLSLSWKSLVLGDVAIGMNLKEVDEYLAGFHSSGFGLDAGGHYSKVMHDIHGLSQPSVRLGVSVKNMTPPSLTFQSTKETLPTEYKFGAAVSGYINNRTGESKNSVVSDKVVLSIDISRTSDLNTPWTLNEMGHSPFSFGLEYAYQNIIPLRIGFNHGLTFGLGYGNSRSPFNIDYALALTDLAPQHRFSFSYFFTNAPSEPSDYPQLRRYRVVLAEAKRFRDRFILDGDKAVRDKHKEEAIENYEKALILDPLNQDIQTVYNRMVSEQTVDTQMVLNRSHEPLTAAATSVPDSYLMNPMESSEALFNGSTKLSEMDQIHDIYHADIKGKNIDEARRVVKRAKTLYPNSPVTIHISDDLVQSEKTLFKAWMDQARAALSKKNEERAEFCFRRAAQIFPDESDLKKELGQFHEHYARNTHMNDSDLLYQNQLYKVAALHYMKGEIKDSLETLRELLGKNVIHEEGRFMLGHLLDKKIIQEDPSNEESWVNAQN